MTAKTTPTRITAPRMYLFAESHDSEEVTPELKNGSALAEDSRLSGNLETDSSLILEGTADNAEVSTA